MKDNVSSIIESNYRKLYGKLFAALFSQFGVRWVSEIEDAIQNSFYKSLKSWKPDKIPIKKENWLFIVARNDVLDQIKKYGANSSFSNLVDDDIDEDISEDLRLKTIIFLAKSNKVSTKTKVIFILKNIFGLSVKEISNCTLLSEDAIYKSNARAKNDLRLTKEHMCFQKPSENEFFIVEEILYAVFSIGFDSFNEKVKSIVNEDLCLEALAVAKILLKTYGLESTTNLLALFCFHLARIPGKIEAGRIIPFYKQDRTKWNQELIALGFHYLTKPKKLNKYYLECLIVSKHMGSAKSNAKHWEEIVELYKLMLTITSSPIIKLNLCYSLIQLDRINEVKKLLNIIENELPNNHFYFSLMKADFLKNSKQEKISKKLVHQTLKRVKQEMRKDFIVENLITEF